jgi:hypothetical protein
MPWQDTWKNSGGMCWTHYLFGKPLSASGIQEPKDEGKDLWQAAGKSPKGRETKIRVLRDGKQWQKCRQRAGVSRLVGLWRNRDWQLSELSDR